MLIVTLVTIVMTAALYVVVPKGFFPSRTPAGSWATFMADQATCFQAMSEHGRRKYATVVGDDPAVSDVIASSGGGRGTTNTANMFITLKDLSVRKVSADQIINRLRAKLSHIPGATLYLQSPQDLRIGGRSSNAQ